LPHEIWIVLLLIVANGVFSAAEMAIVSLRKSRVNTLVEAGRAGARSVRALRDKPEGFLATVQIGITVVGSTASAFGGASIAALVMPHLVPLVGDASGEVSLALVVVGISFLSIILGELVPKSLALRMGEPYALLIAKPLLWMSMLLRPVVWLLTGTSNLVLRLFGDRTSFTETRMSLEEVRSVVEDAGSSGSIDVQSSEMAARAAW
jgi:putative hemolysin